MRDNPACPVCTSRYALYVQDVLGTRTSTLFPQFFCMDCASFFHRSGYRETDEQKRRDFETLSLQNANHESIANRLCLEIITRAPGIETCLEVGYGNGWFLKACRDYGLKEFGFDVNPCCYKFAKEQQLNCALGLLDDSHATKYDAIVAIMVFEHLEQPRDLFGLMTRFLNPDGIIYISVPFIERAQWRYLWTAGDRPHAALPDPFFDNDVHITHFSIDGLRRMGVGLGARSAEYFVSQDTFYHSAGSYPGVLFRF